MPSAYHHDAAKDDEDKKDAGGQHQPYGPVGERVHRDFSGGIDDQWRPLRRGRNGGIWKI